MRGSSPRKMLVGAALAAALAGLFAPGAAQGSRVDVKEINLGPRAAHERGGGTPVVVFRAGAGERNLLEVRGGFKTIVWDRGAELRAGKGCKRLSDHKAKCTIPMTRLRLEVVTFVRANLKGGGDRAAGTAMLWQRLRGGAGADRLIGGPSGDFIDGGTGPDLIKGGTNQPFNGDTAVYTSRDDDLRIDLKRKGRDDGGPRDGKAGHRDRLVGIENVFGGKGDDVMRGDDGDNTLIPILGEDVVRGLGDGDFIDLGRDPFGGGPPDQEPDVANCGEGNDTLQGHDPGLDAIAANCEA